MNQTDGAPTDDKAPLEEVEIRVESDTGSEATTDTTVAGEETPTTNTATEPSGDDAGRSAGKVIADLGNEKKVIAANLVSLAIGSEESRKQVKDMLLKDPATAGYMKAKFGEDYDAIIGDKEIAAGVTPEPVDMVKIQAEADARAQANAIKANLQTNHDNMLEAKAAEFGFTVEEVALYKTKVTLLGGDETALNDAALLVNQAKATAKPGSPIVGGGEAPKPGTKVVTITPGLNGLATDMNLNPEAKKEFAKDIQEVKDLHQDDAFGKPEMVLPGL